MSTINLTSHGLGGGERVVFYNVVPTGTGLDEDVIYTVLVTGLTADTFQVSETGEEDDPLTLALNVTSASMAIVPETTTSDPEDPSYVAVTDPADVHAPPEAITEPQQPVLASDTDTGVVRITITLVAPTDPRIKAVELQVTDEYAVPASAPDAPDFTNAQTLSLMPSTTTFSVRAHPLTTYSARVRHLDIYGNASDWTIPFYGANASIETVAGYDSLNSTITSALDHQIDTVEIKDNAITAPLLAGTIVLGSTIIAGDPDADRVEMNVDGIILYDAAGQPVVVIPTDGVSPVSVKGEVEASTLTSTSTAEFNDTVSLAGGATMTAQSVVTAPIAVPTLASGWETPLTLTPGGGRALAWSMDYTASGGAGGSTKVLYTLTSSGFSYYLEEFLASTGASNRSVLITSSLTPMGLAVHGSSVYVTVQNGSAVDVYVYAISTFTKTTTYSSISNPGDATIVVIASDGTNLYCAAPNSGTGTTRYSKYDSSMSLVSGPTSLTGSTAIDPWHMQVGSFDFGATRILLHPAAGGAVRSWDTSGTEQTAEAFPTDAGGGAADFFYGDVDGTGARFWSRPGVTTLYKHTNWTWGGGGTQAWRVGYAWYLSTGPYETVMGPTGSITTYQRKRLTVANAAIPGGADQVRVYMYPSASAPAAGSSWLQVTDANTTRYITSYTNSGTNDKTSSTFSGGTPAVIQSAGGEWKLSGSGVINRVGTAFPTSPATNDQFWRSDLGMEFFYDGTRWLSTVLHSLTFMLGGNQTLPLTSGLTSHRAAAPILDSDIWLEDLITAFLINSGGTALSGSHKWVGDLKGGLSTTTFATVNIDSGSSAVWRQDIQAIDTLMGTEYELAVTWTKTGTPGNLWALHTVTYRYVAT
jgi:hypothetical protein